MARRLIVVVVGSVALALTTPTAALAVPVQLTVTNAAQPGLESDVAQPPVSVAARGSCATPYSAREANTGVSPCAPGSWPSNNTPPGGDWSPEVRVAGRDRLVLTFNASAEQVRYSSTTNFPRGLLNPVGQPHPNQDVITARDAQPTGNPRVWTVDLPRFDATGHSPWGGYTFSVVARAGAAWRNFAVLIKSPRWNNHQTRCGYFSNPDQFDRNMCIFDYLPGPPPGFGTTDRTAPALRVRLPRRQRVLGRRWAIVYARCDERCTVSITGRLRVGGRSYKLRGERKRAPEGERVLLRLRLTSVAARALRRALRRHRRARIVLALRARDATGNTSKITRRTITLRESGY